MGLDDYLVLGFMTDELESETPQTEKNIDNIFMMNQKTLLDGVDKKLSRYELNYLLDELNDANEEFWKTLLKIIISTYSMNVLKPFLNDSYDELGKIHLKDEVIGLLRFLKIGITEYVDDSENRGMIKRSLFEYVKDKEENTYLMKYFLVYTDSDSWDKFKYKVLQFQDELYYSD